MRLSPTPEQWDSIPELVKRTVDAGRKAIEVQLRYPDHGFDYTIRAFTSEGAVRLSVSLPRASVRLYRDYLDSLGRENPFGVPIATGSWAGNGGVLGLAVTSYLLHEAFPAIIDREHALRAVPLGRERVRRQPGRELHLRGERRHRPAERPGGLRC